MDGVCLGPRLSIPWWHWVGGCVGLEWPISIERRDNQSSHCQLRHHHPGSIVPLLVGPASAAPLTECRAVLAAAVFASAAEDIREETQPSSMFLRRERSRIGRTRAVQMERLRTLGTGRRPLLALRKQVPVQTQ